MKIYSLASWRRRFCADGHYHAWKRDLMPLCAAHSSRATEHCPGHGSPSLQNPPDIPRPLQRERAKTFRASWQATVIVRAHEWDYFCLPPRTFHSPVLWFTCLCLTGLWTDWPHTWDGPATSKSACIQHLQPGCPPPPRPTVNSVWVGFRDSAIIICVFLMNTFFFYSCLIFFVKLGMNAAFEVIIHI